MPEKRYITWAQCSNLARSVAQQIITKWTPKEYTIKRVYAIPNGGIPAALMVQQMVSAQENVLGLEMVTERERADLYIDDIIDSGKTRSQFNDKPFYALIDKPLENIKDTWVVFPWEQMAKQDGPEDNILRILQYIGEDPSRPGLLETPKRVVKSYEELFMGYHNDPKQYVKIFEEQASDCMVILETEFYSHCEHHMAPFFGKAHLAYIPSCGVEHPTESTSVAGKYKVLGASKLARIFDCFARRLQIQERLGAQFSEFLMKSDLQPRGVACRIEATHFCMCSRGVSKQHSKMITTSLEGVFWNQDVRNEFLSLTRS